MSGPGNSAAELLSADGFYALPDEEGYRLELVRGRVVREPLPGPQHGRLDVRLAARLFDHVEQASLGVVLSNTGVVLATDPDTVRGPDLSFVAAARIPTEGYAGGYWRLAPDLVVEILSRSNTASAMEEKVADYLDAGARMVWVIDPRRREAAVHRPGRAQRILRAADALDGEDVLPGFRLGLDELFG